MHCKECGTQLTENSKFCNLCGQQIDDQSKARDTLQQKLLIGSVALVLMLAFVFLAVNYSQPTVATKPILQPPSAQSSPVAFTAPQYTDQAAEITSGSFTVEPRQYRYFKFTVQSAMRQPHVVGRFTATGGGGNDIEVFITNEDGYTNFTNGHSANMWYHSGKTTVGDISTGALPPEEFYLVFNNRFSLMTNKAITAEIRLQYQAVR